MKLMHRKPANLLVTRVYLADHRSDNCQWCGTCSYVIVSRLTFSDDIAGCYFRQGATETSNALHVALNAATSGRWLLFLML